MAVKPGDKPSYAELEARVEVLEKAVEDRDRIEARLKDGEERFRMLYERVPMAYQSLSQDGVLIEVNPAWLKALGYTKDEVLGRSFSEFLHPDWQAHFRENFPRFKAVGEVVGVEFEMRKKDGSTILVSFTGKIGRDLMGNFKQTHCIFQDISASRKAQEALRAEKEFTESALNALQDIFVLFEPDMKKAIRWNRAFETITGYSDEQVARMSLIETCIAPEDRGRARRFVLEVVETGKGAIDVDMVCKNNQRIPTEFNAAAIKNDLGTVRYIIAIGRDIRERKKAERELESSHQRFLTVLDSIDATVYVVDMDTHEILFMNQYMKDVFGRDMTGETCFTAFRSQETPCSFCPIAELKDSPGGDRNVCAWQNRNPVTDKWYMNHDRIIEWTDGRQVKLQIATDITELKQMEARLRQRHKMESIGTLAGGVAHDFNNILGIIMGNTELAMDDTPEWSPVFGYLREIKTASLRAKDVVCQLLSFTRKTEVEQKPLDLNTVVREALTLIRSSIPANIELKDALAASCPVIRADATQIHQVVINLCTNAAHALAAAGGEIRVTVGGATIEKGAPETLQGMVPGQYLELAVADTGTGMAPAVREKIFDPYFTTKAVGKGTGMGLSVVHGIVKNHNAHIRVDTEAGKGSRFSVLFPVTRARPGSDDLDPLPSGQNGNRRTRILFVDDEMAIVKLMKMSLERLGFEVETFTCPEEALDVFTRKSDGFDLVMTDFTMPKMNGIMLMEKIRQIRPDIPVIVCTGHSADIDEASAGRSGIDAYVMKPVSRSQISGVIHQVLGSVLEGGMDKKI